MDTTPIFTHDCDACTFLGTYGNADLYHCMQGGLFPTLIVRKGNEGWEYESGSAFAEMGIPSFVEAEKRARALDLPVTREDMDKLLEVK